MSAIKTLKIKQKHIKQGQKNAKDNQKQVNQCCAIALALQEKYKTKDVRWYFEAGTVKPKGKHIHLTAHGDSYNMVRNWVHLHDHLMPVQPFTLEYTEMK